MSQYYYSRYQEGRFSKAFEHDPEFTGPVGNRSCTDVFCLGIFAAFLVAWISLASYAYSTGNPARLLLPVDGVGNICGQGEFADRPYLFFFDITTCAKIVSSPFGGCPTPQVCVEYCPDETFIAISFTAPDGAPPALTLTEDQIKSKIICKYDVDKSNKTLTELVFSHDCAFYYLKSRSIAGRCVPEMLTNFTEVVHYLLEYLARFNVTEETIRLAERIVKGLSQATHYGEMAMRDLQASWRQILALVAIAMVIAYTWIVLMRWFAGIMVWMSIFIVLAIVAFAFFYTLQRYSYMSEQHEVARLSLEDLDFLALDSYFVNRQTWLIFSGICGTLFFAIAFTMLCLRKRIRIAVALIKEGSKAIGSMPMCLIFPILFYGLELIVLVFSGSVAIYLAGNGEPVWRVANTSGLPRDAGYEEGSICDPMDFLEQGYPVKDCAFTSYGDNPRLIYAHVFNFVGLIWVTAFVLGIEKLTLAYGFASYYWAFDKDSDMRVCAVPVGFYTSLRFHAGSAALGSLVMTILRFVRFLLDAMVVQMHKLKDKATGKYMVWCCSCCFQCLESFVIFVNRHAYTMTAVHGYVFCVAAHKASDLLVRNVVRIVVIDKVTVFLLFIGKLVIVGIMGVVSLVFFAGQFRGLEDKAPELNYFWLPVAFVMYASYKVSNCFFDVYEMAVDTLFVCFLEDCERNDGSQGKPYYMSKELMKILGKTNAFGKPITDLHFLGPSRALPFVGGLYPSGQPPLITPPRQSVMTVNQPVVLTQPVIAAAQPAAYTTQLVTIPQQVVVTPQQPMMMAQQQPTMVGQQHMRSPYDPYQQYPY